MTFNDFAGDTIHVYLDTGVRLTNELIDKISVAGLDVNFGEGVKYPLADVLRWCMENCVTVTYSEEESVEVKVRLSVTIEGESVFNVTDLKAYRWVYNGHDSSKIYRTALDAYCDVFKTYGTEK